MAVSRKHPTRQDPAPSQEQNSFRLMFEGHSAIMLLIDPANGNILEANQAAVDFYGYPRETLRSMTIQKINALPMEAVTREMNRAMRQEKNYFVFPHRLASGEERIVEVHSSPIHLEGKDALFSIIHDITERKQVEDALHQSEQKYRTVADFTYDWEAWRAPDGRYLYNSPSCYRVTKHYAQEFMDDPELLLKIAHPDDQARVRQHYHDVKTHLKEHDVQLDFRIVTPDGETRWISHNCATVTGNDGQWLGRRESNRDITARKLMEQALRESEERYRSLVTNLPVVTFATDRQGIFTLSVGGGLEKLGLLPGQVVGLSVFDVYRDYPDIKEAMRQALQGNTVRTEAQVMGVVFDVIYTPMFDADGRVERVIGVANDVTDRKRIEQELKAQHEFSSQLIAAMGQGLTVTDPDGRFEFVNPAFAHLFGFEPSDLVGKQPSDMTVPEDQIFLAYQRALRKEGRSTTYPSRLRRADGSVAHVLISAVPRWKDGKYNGAIAVITDMTEQKRIEDELREAKQAQEIMNAELQSTLLREQHLARTDTLTGVSNHGHLFNLAKYDFQVALRYHQPLSMLMFDIDDFKQVNDRYGHAVGDLALQRLINAIQPELRAADVIGRYGGDEFTILMPQTAAEDALTLAERIHRNVAAVCLETEKGPLTVTISIGLAQLDQSETGSDMPDTVENLFLRADKALYAAKQAGKNQTKVYGVNGTKSGK